MFYQRLAPPLLQITNSDGVQVANLDLVDGSLYTAGTQRITNAGNLVNIGDITLSGNIQMATGKWIGLGSFSRQNFIYRCHS